MMLLLVTLLPCMVQLVQAQCKILTVDMFDFGGTRSWDCPFGSNDRFAET
jgi:hypothetical protein